MERAWAVLDTVFGTSTCESGREETVGLRGLSGVPFEPRPTVLWRPFLRLLGRAREVRNQHLLANQQASRAPSSLDSGYDTNSASPAGGFTSETPDTGALLGDPFLGLETDFGDEMDWEQVDIWLQGLQDGLSQQVHLDHQPDHAIGALTWW